MRVLVVAAVALAVLSSVEAGKRKRSRMNKRQTFGRREGKLWDTHFPADNPACKPQAFKEYIGDMDGSSGLEVTFNGCAKGRKFLTCVAQVSCGSDSPAQYRLATGDLQNVTAITSTCPLRPKKRNTKNKNNGKSAWSFVTSYRGKLECL